MRLILILLMTLISFKTAFAVSRASPPKFVPMPDREYFRRQFEERQNSLSLTSPSVQRPSSVTRTYRFSNEGGRPAVETTGSGDNGNYFAQARRVRRGSGSVLRPRVAAYAPRQQSRSISVLTQQPGTQQPAPSVIVVDQGRPLYNGPARSGIDNSTNCNEIKNSNANLEARMKVNCASLLSHPRIPAKALSFALQFMRENSTATGLQDKSCLGSGIPQPALIKDGVKNQCQFLINDVGTEWRNMPNRNNAYFIDLCVPNGQPVVREIYANRGTGSANGNYTDISTNKTTVLGPFLTGTQVAPFNGKDKNGKYKELRRQGIPVIKIDLVGLYSTNNDSEFDKYMHTSPLMSSSGCVSVNPENNDIIRTLASNGPSLVLNWDSEHPEVFASTNQCHVSNVSKSQLRAMGSDANPIVQGAR